MTGQVLCAGIHFDAGNDPRIGDGFNKGSAIFLPLADRLIEEDCAANALTETGRGHDQLPIGSPRLLGLGNPQSGKSFVAGRIAFIHRQQALVPGDQRSRGVYKFLRIHVGLSRFQFLDFLRSAPSRSAVNDHPIAYPRRSRAIRRPRPNSLVRFRPQAASADAIRMKCSSVLWAAEAATLRPTTSAP
jgi:hypothetical protein